MMTPASSMMTENGKTSATIKGFRVLLLSYRLCTFVNSSMSVSHPIIRTEVENTIRTKAAAVRILKYSLAWKASPLPSLFPIKVVDTVENTESIPKK